MDTFSEGRVSFRHVSSDFTFVNFRSVSYLVKRLSGPFRSSEILFSVLGDFGDSSGHTAPLFLLACGAGNLLGEVRGARP